MRLSDAEWKVMNVLWSRPWATVRDVHDVLHDETGWAYTTVKTILSRLAEKGGVESRKSSNTSKFRAIIPREAARRSALRALVDRAFDGAFSPLMQCLLADESLGPEDRERIRRLLASDDPAAGEDADAPGTPEERPDDPAA